LIPLLLALLAGCLLPLALAPIDLWPLSFVALGLWFYLLRAHPERSLLLSWIFGIGKYAVGASWIYVSIHRHGNAPVPLALFLVVVFVAGMALFPTLTGWLHSRMRKLSWQLSAVWFVVVFAFSEWLLTWLLTGFPWLFPGYSLLDTPLAGFAPYGGVLLLNLLIAAGAVALVLLIRSFRDVRLRTPGLYAGVLLALVGPWLLALVAGSVSFAGSTGTHRVALVQGNIDQTLKWLPESRGPVVETYTGLSEPHWGVDLLIWPEAAITLFEHEASRLLEELDETGRRHGTGLILGIPAVEVVPGNRVIFRNTAIGLGTAEGRYVKRRLVPFGEYVPLESLLRGLIEFFDLPMSRAEPGNWRQVPLRVAGHSAQMAICYEVVYPLLVSRPETSLLLTISNDTWFGDSLGPRQHLQMARMRALENERWLLRGTNNGITAIIDPAGVVTGQLPQFEAGVLTGAYQTMTGRTPFSRFGNWPFLGALVALTAAVLALRKRAE
jgi:apolipoprotein N-acyltransferase